jgi:ribosomal protein L25 (general stress protein Ctc)
LHADQIQGFFDIPVDNIYASPVLLGDLRQKNYEDLIVVSPDVGGVVRARALAKQLGCDMAIIDKRRPKANVSEVMHVIGDIDGRNCVIMDDMIDTAGTLVKAAEVLKERGAKKVYAYCTHPIFSGPAIERIAKGSALDEVVVTNTIPLSEAAKAAQKSPTLRGAADCRNHPAHCQGRVGDEFVLRSREPVLTCALPPDGRLASIGCLHQASFGRLACSGAPLWLVQRHGRQQAFFKQGTLVAVVPFQELIMKFVAFERAKQGTGASRRLRNSGRTPGIVYGGSAEPQLIEVDHNALWHALKKEAFHSSVLDMELAGKTTPRFCCATCNTTPSSNWCCTLTSSAWTKRPSCT